MMNYTMIVGRLVDNPKVQETDNGKKYVNMTVAVPRAFKNAEGVYESDFVDCVLWSGVAEKTSEYCKKGDLVGVKGRVQTDLYEKDGETRKSMKLVAEKVSFLSTKSKDIQEEIDDKSSKKPKKETSKDRS